VPLSRRPAERVSFGGHGYAPPRNAFLRAGEASLELIKALPARPRSCFSAMSTSARAALGLRGSGPRFGMVLDRSHPGQRLLAV
jgi:hypothetical protein